MSTLTRDSAAFQRTATQTVAAGNAPSITITAPQSGQTVHIDTVSLSYQGTVQTFSALSIAEQGTGTTLWTSHVVGPSAGLGFGHFTWPSGFRCTAATGVVVSSSSLANCESRLSVSYHLETAG